ncbi:LEAF RUST 10 DISEASE-RESISTANCE LOCUS RECEPTOR-LIKE PROTEIN KINASE-like [Olea europaea subsp. europaea]|uniref:LEAF RUST 10 DISEASE-RESISTANCE LOCUS RECEPTOR-LIKE PROTEIN KINASE-like n=1 Tax=Olea europaea subsp. europaea TaxID=158383 RepID=A0A8S0U1J5_OLEEU|nr:LEAF RUST 10 DISEASE-RESISTANCE LOCUS RECEPTOR-LIKE PROTEIN KINASE-like [Olea europaea subsp. europaea]
MRNIKLLFAISMVFLILLHCATYCEADCHPTSCGSITNISYPFRLRGDPENENCSNSSYELACVNNRAILYLSFGTFFVQSISYNDYSIRLLDPGMEKNSCDSFPKNRVPLNYDYDYRFTPYYYDYRFTPYSLEPYDVAKLNTMIAYIHCEAPAESPFYVDTCICSKNISLQKYSYLVELIMPPVQTFKMGWLTDLTLRGTQSIATFPTANIVISKMTIPLDAQLATACMGVNGLIVRGLLV